MAHHVIDIAVIGAGAHGVATTLSLTEMGIKNIVCFDRARPPYGVINSHGGDTRVSRVILPDGKNGDNYTEAVLSIKDIWRQREEAYIDKIGRDRPCLQRMTGFLTIQNRSIATLGNSGVHGAKDYITPANAMAERYGVTHSADTQQLLQRFDQFLPMDGSRAYYEDDGSVLIVRQCLETQRALAEHGGARFCLGTTITDVTNTGDGVTITTAAGDTYYAAKAVVAPGAWLPDFLPPSFKAPIERYQQTLYWYEMDEPELYTDIDRRFPSFIYMTSGGNFFYGKPALHDAGDLHIVKGLSVATERFVAKTLLERPEDLSPAPPEGELAVMQQAVEMYLGNHGRRKAKKIHHKTCIYTKHADHFDFRFGIDKNIMYVLACAGHGFKLSPWVGRESARSIMQGQLTPSLAPFSFDRRAVQCEPSSPAPEPEPARPLPHGLLQVAPGAWETVPSLTSRLSQAIAIPK